MALSLSSTNPKFSWLIQKRPPSELGQEKSSMQIRKLGSQATSFGWYASEQEYCIRFVEPRGTDQAFYHQKLAKNYWIKILSDYFGSILKAEGMTPEREEMFDGGKYLHQLSLNLIYIRATHYIKKFNDFFDDVTIELGEGTQKYYPLTIKSHRSLHYLMNVSALLLLFIVLLNERRRVKGVGTVEGMDITESLVEKYVTVIERLNAPYYIRYLFARHLLTQKKLFKKFSTRLEKTSQFPDGAVKMYFGDTGIQRLDFLTEHWDFSHSILDLGCGEGYYLKRWVKRLSEDNTSYYAIDIDEMALNQARRMADRVDVDQRTVFYNSLSAFLDNDLPGEEIDVLMTEVVEHMPVEEAGELVMEVLKKVNFRNFWITTPDRDFNPHYLLEDKFRHHDHDWEMNSQEFQEWIARLVSQIAISGSKRSFKIEFFPIGNRIGEVATTQGVKISVSE